MYILEWFMAEKDESLAIEAMNTAMGAVSTIAALAGFSVAALTLMVAVFALLGWAALAKMARTKAATVANTAVNAYIKSPQFARMLERKVAREVAMRMRTEQIAENTDPDDADPFPEASLKEEDDR